MAFFINKQGRQLAYNMLVPPKVPAPVVIFSHGFDSSKDSPRSRPIADELLNEGVASFLFDYTGHGQSQGNKLDSTIEQQADDLESAIALLKGMPEIDFPKLALHGSSSGCLPILFNVETNQDASAIVLRAPRTDGQFPEILARATDITCPVLVIQGEYDPLLEDTKVFYAKLKTEKEFKVIGGADHLFTNPEHFTEVRAVTVKWLNNRLKA
ncbi:MAG: hypothetical protein C4562_05315 [Actinobacteria bacterium]|nr:MAG: hypothetical protein C4562_05315 [Actinomycetota bacterium]